MDVQLSNHGRPVVDLFDLLGYNENSMTTALAFAMARSPVFLARVLLELGYPKLAPDSSVSLRLQTRREESGITDVEIQVGNEFLGILEAKKGPELPSARQLALYAPVLTGSIAKRAVLAAITNATPAFAKVALAQLSPPGLTVRHLSWRQVRGLAVEARRLEKSSGNRILADLIHYLEDLIDMERRFDNRVYVVSLSEDIQPGTRLSFRQVVEERGMYLYSVGRGWPDPPNYMGFRYGGRLQHIRLVISFEVIRSYHDVFPEAPPELLPYPEYCIRLGPPIFPSKTITNGPRINRAIRVFCMIDTLLVSDTISEALTETERRTNANE